MICPHCRRNVLRKNRTGNRCGECRRTFALEPKENPLNLHDVRLMRLAQKLSGDGSLRFTTHQLYYAASRKAVRRVGRFPVVPLVLSMLVVPGLFTVGTVAEVPALRLVAGAMTVLWVLYLVVRFAGRNNRRVEPPMTHQKLVGLLDRWRATYRADLPGLIREAAGPGPNPERPVLALICPDLPTRVCLWANGTPVRHGVLLVAHPAEVPAWLPVALLHDVGVDGYRFAADVRAALGRRVVADLTPRPDAVRTAPAVIRLRQPAPAPELMRRLADTGTFSAAELEWLGKGWWSPVAALRPSTLVNRVSAVAARAGDPEQRAAAAVGFLTWPRP